MRTFVDEQQMMIWSHVSIFNMEGYKENTRTDGSLSILWKPKFQVLLWWLPGRVSCLCRNMSEHADCYHWSVIQASSKHLNKHLHSVDLLKLQQRDFPVYPILLGPLKLCDHHFWEFELSVMWRFHVSIGKRPVGESPTSLLCGVQFTPTKVSRKYGWFSLW